MIHMDFEQKRKRSAEDLPYLIKTGDQDLANKAREEIVKAGLPLRDEYNEMIELSVGESLDASDSPTIPVISRTMEFVTGITKDGRDINGAVMKTSHKVEKAIIAEAKHKSSDMFMAKQIKFHENT